MIGLLVALGGALGAVTRYGVDATARARFDDERPFGVLIVNVVGSLLLGVALGWSLNDRLSTDPFRVVASGLLGGFTTFSTVALDTVVLGEDSTRMGVAYMTANVVLCIGAAAAGMLVGGAF